MGAEFVAYAVNRCCQTNANQSLFSSNINMLGGVETAPLGQSGAVKLEIWSAVKVASLVEVAID